MRRNDGSVARAESLRLLKQKLRRRVRPQKQRDAQGSDWSQPENGADGRGSDNNVAVGSSSNDDDRSPHDGREQEQMSLVTAEEIQAVGEIAPDDSVISWHEDTQHTFSQQREAEQANQASGCECATRSPVCHTKPTQGNPCSRTLVANPRGASPCVAPPTATSLPITSKRPDQSKPITKLVVQWSCRHCQRECIPVREESRCLCGHRYKEHPTSRDDRRVTNKAGFRALACTSSRCACNAFFYVVAEGAWVLRCRCKHKHIDHDPSAAPFQCRKPKCACNGFDSHPWSEHEQTTVTKQFTPLQFLQQQFQLEELNRVERTDLLAQPLVLHH